MSKPSVTYKVILVGGHAELPELDAFAQLCIQWDIELITDASASPLEDWLESAAVPVLAPGDNRRTLSQSETFVDDFAVMHYPIVFLEAPTKYRSLVRRFIEARRSNSADVYAHPPLIVFDDLGFGSEMLNTYPPTVAINANPRVLVGTMAAAAGYVPP